MNVVEYPQSLLLNQTKIPAYNAGSKVEVYDFSDVEEDEGISLVMSGEPQHQQPLQHFNDGSSGDDYDSTSPNSYQQSIPPSPSDAMYELGGGGYGYPSSAAAHQGEGDGGEDAPSSDMNAASAMTMPMSSPASITPPLDSPASSASPSPSTTPTPTPIPSSVPVPLPVPPAAVGAGVGAAVPMQMSMPPPTDPAIRTRPTRSAKKRRMFGVDDEEDQQRMPSNGRRRGMQTRRMPPTHRAGKRMLSHEEEYEQMDFQLMKKIEEMKALKEALDVQLITKENFAQKQAQFLDSFQFAMT